jgi:hypothetical protein
MRRGFAWAAAVVLAGASAITAAEIGPLGACLSDAHAGLTCGAGNGAARVIADTISPSKRLALAWRSPSGPLTEQPDEDDIELLLIRLSDGAVLSQQKGAYWDTGESHANRLYEGAFWSPDSRLIVKTYETRFSTDGMTVYAIGPDDKASAPLDLLKILEPAVRAQLRRTVKSEEPYVFSIRRLTVDNRGLIRTTVMMWVPKEGPSAAFDVAAMIAPKGGALTARITSMHRTREKL